MEIEVKFKISDKILSKIIDLEASQLEERKNLVNDAFNQIFDFNFKMQLKEKISNKILATILKNQ